MFMLTIEEEQAYYASFYAKYGEPELPKLAVTSDQVIPGLTAIVFSEHTVPDVLSQEDRNREIPTYPAWMH